VKKEKCEKLGYKNKMAGPHQPAWLFPANSCSSDRPLVVSKQQALPTKTVSAYQLFT